MGNLSQSRCILGYFGGIIWHNVTYLYLSIKSTLCLLYAYFMPMLWFTCSKTIKNIFRFYETIWHRVLYLSIIWIFVFLNPRSTVWNSWLTFVLSWIMTHDFGSVDEFFILTDVDWSSLHRENKKVSHDFLQMVNGQYASSLT